MGVSGRLLTAVVLFAINLIATFARPPLVVTSPLTMNRVAIAEIERPATSSRLAVLSMFRSSHPR